MQRTDDSVLLIPPGQRATVKVSRERFTRLSTELVWVFTAVASCNTDFESHAIVEQKGFLKKKWSLRFPAGENPQLRNTLENLLSGELNQLVRKAGPERIIVEVGGSTVRVRIVKTLTSPIATPLVHCYDLSLILSTTLSEILGEK